MQSAINVLLRTDIAARFSKLIENLPAIQPVSDTLDKGLLTGRLSALETVDTANENRWPALEIAAKALPSTAALDYTHFASKYSRQ